MPNICQTQGILIIPMVTESTGYWDPEAYKVPKHIAYVSAVRLGRDPAEMLGLFLEEFSLTIYTWRTRTAWRRRYETIT